MGLLLLSSIVALLIGELLLRFSYPVDYRVPADRREPHAWKGLIHRPSPVPGLDYEPSPDVAKSRPRAMVRTNSYGMRDTEPLPKETEGLVRLVALGDPFTFGFCVREDQTYPNVLEDLLNRSAGGRGCRFDVLNLGVGGYSTRDEALVLKHKALRWEPNLVIGYTLNDPESEPIRPLHAHFAAPRWWQHSHLLRLIALAKNQRDVRRLDGGDYYRYLHAEGSAKWRSVVEALHDMAETASGAEIPLLLVIFSHAPPEGWTAHPHADIHERVAAAARAAGIDVLDLADPFSRYDPLALRARPADPHPSPPAHALAAEAIRRHLVTRHPDVLFGIG